LKNGVGKTISFLVEEFTRLVDGGDRLPGIMAFPIVAL
jgi:hypothetical protein